MTQGWSRALTGSYPRNVPRMTDQLERSSSTVIRSGQLEEAPTSQMEKLAGIRVGAGESQVEASETLSLMPSSYSRFLG